MTTPRTMMGPLPAVPADETFDGTWPFEARYTDAPGFQMHYVEQGDGAETLLLLHGEPTWGYLFRHQIPVWSKHARVLAVDHMGFGKSATPQNRSYWLQDHIDNLEAFVLALDLWDITLVMHDFGGPVGMGLAARSPERIKRVISVNGPTPFGQPDLTDRLTANVGVSPWFQWILRAEESGVLEEILGHLDYNILSTLKLNGFARNEIVTDAWIRAYGARFSTPAQAAGAIGWAKGVAAYLDYPVALSLMVAPFLLGLGSSHPLALWLAVGTGVAAFILTLLTDHKLGVFRVLPYSFHLTVDGLVGVAFLLVPTVFGLDAWYYWANGAAVVLVVILHRPETALRQVPLTA